MATGERKSLFLWSTAITFFRLPLFKSLLAIQLRTAVSLLMTPFRIFRSSPRPPGPVKKALLIGIVYPGRDDWEELPGTSRDVSRLRDTLIERFDYRPEHIVVMTDDKSVGVAPHLNPTKTNILREIRALVAGAQDGDHFLFHFAGHSDQMECKRGSEEDGTDEILICADARRIKDNKLHKMLVLPLPPGASLTTIFDSCNSGTLLDLEHYMCNNVWVPWVNKGQRRTLTLQSRTNRRNALSRGRAPCLDQSLNKELDSELGPLPGSSSSFKQSATPTRTLSLKNGSTIEVTLKTFSQSKSIGEVLAPLDTNINVDKFVERTTPYTSHFGPRSSSPASNGDSACWSFLLDPEYHRSQSPLSIYPRYCDGHCRGRVGGGVADKPHPLVVSISASRDGQAAWSDVEDSVTLSLIKILEEKPSLSFHELMTKLNHRVHASTMAMHRYALEEKRKIRGTASEDQLQIEMNNFQEPQLGSISPLNMDDLFIL